jgi:hypothetical protein
MLGGYVYASYTYPPNEPTTLEPNLFLVLAPRPYYGLTLYRPQYQQQYPQLLQAWSKIAPHLGYSDYPTWLLDDVGAPLGPSRPILKLIFPTLDRSGVQTATLAGLAAWGYGGVHNYLVAKLLWNPNSDVDALYHDYLDRAYGPAAASMDRLYSFLDDLLSEYKQNTTRNEWKVTKDLLQQVYVKQFDSIEGIYREALSKAASDTQRRRIELFGDNLIVLHATLRAGGAFEKPDSSIFYRAEDDYGKFLSNNKDSVGITSPPSDWKSIK